MQIKYVVLLLTLINILVLYGLSTLTQPTPIDLIDLPDYEGQQVIVKGKITHHYTTSYGSHFIEIVEPEKNQSRKATLFLEETANVSYGDTIQATGTVQQYKNTWEILVNSPQQLKCLKKWNDTTLPLSILSISPERYVGMNIQVSGTLDRIYDSFCYLTDTQGSCTLTIVFNKIELPRLYPGAFVCVGGQFEFNSHTLRYQLTLSDITHFVDFCEE